MTAMLASVSNLEEALLIERIGVDVIDLKQPAQGALGALDVTDVRHILNHLQPDTCISATVGDLPMQPELLLEAVSAMADTGVDYVKIGFFPKGDWQSCIAQLGTLCAQGHALIAVFFADTQPDFFWIDALAKAGFTGVMLDTMNKNAGSLTRNLTPIQIETFIHQAKSHSLLTGLAGSLRLSDIDTLMHTNTDYLGFRGALCNQHDRIASLNEDNIYAIKHRLSGGLPKKSS